MDETKTLEEIFWKDGKFLDSKGDEVKAKPIGEPQSIIGITFEERYNEKILIKKSLSRIEEYSQKYEGVNAFSKGEFKNVGFTIAHYICPIQLYKI